jgi:hypothetical protein
MDDVWISLTTTDGAPCRVRADEIAALEGGLDKDGAAYTQVILAGASFSICVRAELGELHKQIAAALTPTLVLSPPKKRAKPNGKRDTPAPAPAPPEPSS